jgi:hypothetical protein
VLDEGRQFFLARVDVLGLDESIFQSSLKNMILKPGMVYNQSLVDLFLRKSSSALRTDPSEILRSERARSSVDHEFVDRFCHPSGTFDGKSPMRSPGPDL